MNGSSRPLLARALAWTFAVWVVHAVLRLAVLARPDAFGLPFVGKVDWYIFHAMCFDLRWITVASLPFVAHVGFWEHRKAWWAQAGLWSLYGLHGLLLVVTLIDHETYRFMGCHFSPDIFSTYGNTAAGRQLLGFLSNDKGGRFLPIVLLLGAIPLAYLVARWLRTRRWFSDKPALKGLLITFVVANLTGWLYTEMIWGGGFRAKKLAPVWSVWWTSLREARTSRVPDAEFKTLTAAHQARWKAENASDSLWDFPDAKLPYWKVPRGGEHVAPRDSQWNIVLIVLESHRGLNCGFLKAEGATRDATPFLNSIAPSAEVWTRYQCPALPTVRALTSIHLGILNHPTKNLTSDNMGLANRALPAILGQAGWTTAFFSAADPAWDNQTPWLRQWYQRSDYDRSRENDRDLFAHGAKWMRKNLGKDKPFFVAFMSKTNHYPFNPVPGVEDAGSGDLQKRMDATMRYTERSVAAMVDSLRREPWFDRTIFVITGDHAFPLEEHGSSSIGYGLYSESVWLPLVIWGKHPQLKPGTRHDAPASHLDLGPTLLRLAGVRKANHFTGRDLLAPVPEGLMRVTTGGDELLVTTAKGRYHGTLSGNPRERGAEAFAASDILERTPLDPGQWDAELLSRARAESRLLEAVLQRNGLCPPQPAEGKQGD
ncbi:MAG: hypothetical protein RL318_767 [Fibrobacterota bacterium]|jgi:hypothetical protein